MKHGRYLLEWNEWVCNKSCMVVVLLHHQYEEDQNGLRHHCHPNQYSPLSSQLSQFHSCEETMINDNLSDYHESEAPLTSLLSLPFPPSGTIGNPIVVSNDKNDIDSLFSRPSYYEVQSIFTTPLQLLYCRDCTNRRHFYFDCPQCICDHCLMHAPHHRKSNCLNR
jgi:hypothetical protein